MENFTNENIDITTLPKFEEVQFTPLHPKYKNLIVFNLAMIISVLFFVSTVVFFLKSELFNLQVILMGLLFLVSLSGVLILIALTSFRKRGFAFREHDVVFKSGVISDTTTIIPYNRVQHVAVHQGFISRKLGLASVEIFTAGGSGSDLEIPGIQKEQAEKIKQLLMTKLNSETKDNATSNDGENGL